MMLTTQNPLGDGHVESVIEEDEPMSFATQVGILTRMALSDGTESFRLVASYGGMDGLLSVSDSPDNLDMFIESVTSEDGECHLRGTFLVDGTDYDVIHIDEHRICVIHDARNDIMGALRRMGILSTRA